MQFSFQRDHWRTLRRRVWQILDLQPESLPIGCTQATEAEANRINERLLRVGASLADAPGAGEPSQPSHQEADLQCVGVNSLQLVRPRSVGVDYVDFRATEQVGMPSRLQQLGPSGLSATPFSSRSSVAWLLRPPSQTRGLGYASTAASANCSTGTWES